MVARSLHLGLASATLQNVISWPAEVVRSDDPLEQEHLISDLLVLELEEALGERSHFLSLFQLRRPAAHLLEKLMQEPEQLARNEDLVKQRWVKPRRGSAGKFGTERKRQRRQMRALARGRGLANLHACWQFILKILWERESSWR